MPRNDTRRRAGFAGLAAASAIIWAGIGATAPSTAEDLDAGVGACVWASVRVASTTLPTVKLDTNGSTCPALPPNPANPCPEGTGIHNSTPVAVVDKDVLVCVRGL